jgi:hypothetical protein
VVLLQVILHKPLLLLLLLACGCVLRWPVVITRRTDMVLQVLLLL